MNRQKNVEEIEIDSLNKLKPNTITSYRGIPLKLVDKTLYVLTRKPFGINNMMSILNFVNSKNNLSFRMSVRSQSDFAKKLYQNGLFHKNNGEYVYPLRYANLLKIFLNEHENAPQVDYNEGNTLNIRKAVRYRLTHRKPANIKGVYSRLRRDHLNGETQQSIINKKGTLFQNVNKDHISHAYLLQRPLNIDSNIAGLKYTSGMKQFVKSHMLAKYAMRNLVTALDYKKLHGPPLKHTLIVWRGLRQDPPSQKVGDTYITRKNTPVSSTIAHSMHFCPKITDGPCTILLMELPLGFKDYIPITAWSSIMYPNGTPLKHEEMEYLLTADIKWVVNKIDIKTFIMQIKTNDLNLHKIYRKRDYKIIYLTIHQQSSNGHINHPYAKRMMSRGLHQQLHIGTKRPRASPW